MKKRTNLEIDDLLSHKNIIRLGDYIGSKHKILFKCIIDNHEWYARPDVIIGSNNGCPKCCNSIRITNKSIDDEILKKDIQIIRLGDYKNDKTKIKFECKKCGNIWKTRWDVVKNHNCPICAKKIKLLNIDKVNDILKTIDFLPLEKENYKGIYNKCNFICANNPDHIIRTHFASIKKYGACPLCKSPNRMEYYVEKQLRKKYEKVEKNFKLCFNNRKYFIDFYLPELNVFIEYNGKQHYEPVLFFSSSVEDAKEKFELQKKRDREVSEYIENVLKCKLYIIPYSKNKKSINSIIEGL